MGRVLRTPFRHNSSDFHRCFDYLQPLATLTNVETERLYYTDSYLCRFQANIIKITDEGTRVYLDRTAFYPSSGGQPHDIGLCNGIDVIDVVDEGGVIAHKVASPLTEGASHCTVNWNRRYDHMQQHTGQHLLSAVFHDLFGFETLSFHLGPEVSTIELSAAELSTAQIDEAEEAAAALIAKAVPIHVSFEHSEKVEGLRKESARSGTLRIVEIEGIDRSACGGTHLRATSELGLIVTRRQEKVRGNVRIEFVCGMRCLRRAREDFRLLQQIARQASVSIDRLSEVYESTLQRLLQTEKERSKLVIELARRDGRSEWERTAASADGLRRVRIERNEIGDETRAFAQSFIEQGKAAIIITTPQLNVLFAVSKDSGMNAGKLLKEALEKQRGRGGGSPTIAQGSVSDQSALESVVAKLLA